MLVLRYTGQDWGTVAMVVEIVDTDHEVEPEIVVGLMLSCRIVRTIAGSLTGRSMIAFHTHLRTMHFRCNNSHLTIPQGDPTES